jgi:glucose-6-phosphate 1-epimerase
VHHTVLSRAIPKKIRYHCGSANFKVTNNMLSNVQNLSVEEQLQPLLNACGFLQLTTSKDYYPNSKGAGLPLIRVQTALCNAVIALQGAQLLEFTAAKGKPLLWLSPHCDFTAGTALRGGVPVCLPWFGPNSDDAKKPKHGFARNQNWQLQHATLLNDGSAELIFAFISTSNNLFAFNFSAELKITLGDSAKLELSVTNRDAQALDCSWALHSYHPVSALSDVRVTGLAGKIYLDNVENHAEKFQAEDVNFLSEVDRVFHNIENTLTIAGSPNILITHHNCPSVIVWNPGANAANIADIGAGNEQHYICVERGAVLKEKWNLKAGESKSGWLEFREIK